MDLTEEIAKMNFYKTFEPYIDPSVTMEQRMKGRHQTQRRRTRRSQTGPLQMDRHENEEPPLLKEKL